jgi:hypothetical protein
MTVPPRQSLSPSASSRRGAAPASGPRPLAPRSHRPRRVHRTRPFPPGPSQTHPRRPPRAPPNQSGCTLPLRNLPSPNHWRSPASAPEAPEPCKAIRLSPKVPLRSPSGSCQRAASGSLAARRCTARPFDRLCRPEAHRVTRSSGCRVPSTDIGARMRPNLLAVPAFPAGLWRRGTEQRHTAPPGSTWACFDASGGTTRACDSVNLACSPWLFPTRAWRLPIPRGGAGRLDPLQRRSALCRIQPWTPSSRSCASPKTSSAP